MLDDVRTIIRDGLKLSQLCRRKIRKEWKLVFSSKYIVLSILSIVKHGAHVCCAGPRSDTGAGDQGKAVKAAGGDSGAQELDPAAAHNNNTDFYSLLVTQISMLPCVDVE